VTQTLQSGIAGSLENSGKKVDLSMNGCNNGKAMVQVLSTPDRTIDIGVYVTKVLGASPPDGFLEALKLVTQYMDAHGCTLWEEGLPRSSPEEQDQVLFLLGAWFPNGNAGVIHEFPVAGTVTGRVVQSGEAVHLKRVRDDDQVYKFSFMEDLHLGPMLCVPVEYQDGNRGALTVYREETHAPFSREDAAELGRLATLMPNLLQSQRERQGFMLLAQVRRTLYASWREQEDGQDEVGIRNILRKVCEHLAETFQCMEVSIVLDTQTNAPYNYEVVATTWPYQFDRKTYRRSKKDGVTGWVLAVEEAVRLPNIFDLRDNRRKARILIHYPGLTWSDALRLATGMRKILGLAKNAPLPPASAIAVPIFAEERVIGVLRCSAIRHGGDYCGPFLFTDRDLKLLKLVAIYISDFSQALLRDERREAELKAWKMFLDGMSELTGNAQSALQLGHQDEMEVFRKALDLANKVIPCAQINDIRLADKEKKYLEYVVFWGDEWERGNQDEIVARKARTFLLNDPGNSVGARVLHENRAIIDNKTSENPEYRHAFPDLTTGMIIAPIGTATDVVGVMDFRTTEDRTFPRYATTIVELLGRQLGLYHALAATVKDVETHRAKLAKVVQQQQNFFKDISHQLKNPINDAVNWASQAIDKANPVPRYLYTLQGGIRSVRRVARTMGVLEKLLAEKRLSIKKEVLDLRSGDFERLLVECAEDNEMSVKTRNPDMRIRFAVDKDSLLVTVPGIVYADLDLLEQCINNILDNAGKYSYRNTTVHIGVSLSTSGKFVIWIENSGFGFQSGEAAQAKTREWRSTEAQDVTGEGSGIGLWFVDHVIMAMGGELQIIPFNQERRTQIELLLPVTKQEG